MHWVFTYAVNVDLVFPRSIIKNCRVVDDYIQTVESRNSLLESI